MFGVIAGTKPAVNHQVLVLEKDQNRCVALGKMIRYDTFYLTFKKEHDLILRREGNYFNPIKYVHKNAPKRFNTISHASNLNL